VSENRTFVLVTYVHDPLARSTSLVYGNGTTQSYAWSQETASETILRPSSRPLHEPNSGTRLASEC